MNSEAKADPSVLEACETMESKLSPVLARVRRSAAELIDNAETMARTGRSSSDKLHAVRPSPAGTPAVAPAPGGLAADEVDELTARFAALRQP